MIREHRTGPRKRQDGRTPGSARRTPLLPSPRRGQVKMFGVFVLSRLLVPPKSATPRSLYNCSTHIQSHLETSRPASDDWFTPHQPEEPVLGKQQSLRRLFTAVREVKDQRPVLPAFSLGQKFGVHPGFRELTAPSLALAAQTVSGCPPGTPGAGCNRSNAPVPGGHLLPAPWYHWAPAHRCPPAP